MSQGLLYHGFGVQGYRWEGEDFSARQWRIRIAPEPGSLRCVACGSREVIRRGQELREFRALPLGSKPTTLVLGVPRVECRACGCLRQVAVDFAPPRRRHTHGFARYALELSQLTTIQDAARHLGVSGDTIKEMQKDYLRKHYAQPKLKHLQQIAIDEIAVARGHTYNTVVLDLDSGAIVYVGKGRGADALDAFWIRLRARHAQIEAVAMDLSAAYQLAVRAHLPKAAIVFDHFHLIKLYNDKLSALRRDMQREATDLLHKKTLKGTRWLLLRNPENLDAGKDEPRRLREALKLNAPLATAYYLKEDLRQLWNQRDKKAGEAFLNGWVRRAQSAGITMLQQFAKTLQEHRRGILAWYDYPISTGPLEGTNHKIKTLKRMAYGYRDQEFFRLKLFALHVSKYALVG
jgi:transposase